jgi:hypothetical protein
MRRITGGVGWLVFARGMLLLLLLLLRILLKGEKLII